MFSGAFSYPYTVFRSDLRALSEILGQKTILRHTGEEWDAADYEGGDHIVALKVGSYFTRRYPVFAEMVELNGVYMMSLTMIEQHIDVVAPGQTMDDLIGSGFDLASESILQAIHALHTEVDLREWGDDHDATFDFVLEFARTRFGYED